MTMSSCPDQTISNRFHLHHLLVFALVWSSLCVICFSHFFFNFFEFHKRCVVGTPKLFLFPTNLLVVARCRPRPSSHASIMPSLGAGVSSTRYSGRWRRCLTGSWCLTALGVQAFS